MYGTVLYCIPNKAKYHLETVQSGNYAIFIVSYTIIIIIIIIIIITIIIIIRRRRRRRRTLKATFQDIGLYCGLDKCATVNVVRGKIVQSTNVNLNNDE